MPDRFADIQDSNANWKVVTVPGLTVVKGVFSSSDTSRYNYCTGRRRRGHAIFSAKTESYDYAATLGWAAAQTNCNFAAIGASSNGGGTFSGQRAARSPLAVTASQTAVRPALCDRCEAKRNALY